MSLAANQVNIGLPGWLLGLHEIVVLLVHLIVRNELQLGHIIQLADKHLVCVEVLHSQASINADVVINKH